MIERAEKVNNTWSLKLKFTGNKSLRLSISHKCSLCGKYVVQIKRVKEHSLKHFIFHKWLNIEFFCLLYSSTANQNEKSLAKRGFWIHQKSLQRKPKISNITFAILPFFHHYHDYTVTKLLFWVLWSPLLFKETIRCASKWFILTTTNLEFGHLKCVAYTWDHHGLSLYRNHSFILRIR